MRIMSVARHDKSSIFPSLRAWPQGADLENLATSQPSLLYFFNKSLCVI